jgi:protein disulfide-isomerase
MRARIGLLGIVLAALAHGNGIAAPSPVQWQTTLEGAKRLAAQNNQLVLIHFWAPYCGVCRRMEEEVFPDPRVAQVIQQLYVPVKLNTEYFPATAQQFGITKLPTDVVLSPGGQLLRKMEGLSKAPEYAAELMQIANSVRPPAPAVNATRPVYANMNNGPAGQPGANLTANPSQPPTAGPGQQPMPQNVQYADQRSVTPSMQPNMPQGMVASIPPSMQQGMSPGFSPAAVAPAAPSAPAFGLPGGSAPSVSLAPSANQNGPAVTNSAGQPAMPASTTPTLALDGFCPVELMEHHNWVPGDKKFGVIHLGRTYLFAGPEQWQRFFANPEKYAPVLSGMDVVVAVERNQLLPGDRRFGGYYENKLYLFTSEDTLQKFNREPQRYAMAVAQAFRVTQSASPR